MEPGNKQGTGVHPRTPKPRRKPKERGRRAGWIHTAQPWGGGGGGKIQGKELGGTQSGKGLRTVGRVHEGTHGEQQHGLAAGTTINEKGTTGYRPSQIPISRHKW